MVHTSYSFKISGFMMAWFFWATITASLFQMKNVITGSLKINVAGLQSDKDGKSSVVHVSIMLNENLKKWHIFKPDSKVQKSVFIFKQTLLFGFYSRDMSWTFLTSRTPQKTSLSKWEAVELIIMIVITTITNPQTISKQLLCLSLSADNKTSGAPSTESRRRWKTSQLRNPPPNKVC